MKKSPSLLNHIIFILGTTASGKSKLALNLAQKLDGVIVNADSMQIYKSVVTLNHSMKSYFNFGGNYGIMTAKPTEKELDHVDHRLYGHVGIDDIDYNVDKWTNEATQVIQEIFEQQKVPIVCGGTGHYVRALMLINEANVQRTEPIEIDTSKFTPEVDLLHQHMYEKYWVGQDQDNQIAIDESTKESDVLDKATCYQLLKHIDPDLCDYYPENDNRRVLNALRKFYRSKGTIRESEVKKNQKIRLRYPNTLVIRIQTELKEIETRITDRIGQMLLDPLPIGDDLFTCGFHEICTLFNYFESKKAETSDEIGLNDQDFSKGILQSIGYKEFYPLYLKLKEDELLDIVLKDHSIDDISKISDMFNDENSLKLTYLECKTKLITKTLNYAKYQTKYINKRILKTLDDNCDLVSGSETVDDIMEHIESKFPLDVRQYMNMP